MKRSKRQQFPFCERASQSTRLPRVAGIGIALAAATANAACLKCVDQLEDATRAVWDDEDHLGRHSLFACGDQSEED